MSEPRVRYEDNLYHYALQQEIASLERHIHHDIDNRIINRIIKEDIQDDR